MEIIRNKDKKNIYSILVFTLSMILMALAGCLYGKTTVDLVADTIIAGILAGSVIFVFNKELICGNFLFNNSEHTEKFFLFYIVCLIISCIFPLIAESGWTYLVIYALLCVSSSMLLGFVSGSILLMFSVLLTPVPQVSTLFMYMIPGLVIVILFSTINEDFKVINPLLIALLTQFICLCISEVLLVNKTFSITQFFIPAVNIFASAALILIILKFLSFSLVYKSQDIYMDILDPEFELLVKLKNHSKEEYDHTIYTAVLCSKLATNLGLDESITKACGYYHRIGLLNDDISFEKTEKLLDEYNIPSEVKEILRDYSNNETEIKTREACVLLFADTVISSISYLFMKDKDAQIDYDRLISTVIDKKISSGVLKNSKVSFEDLNVIKNTLINEKLFYDFLR